MIGFLVKRYFFSHSLKTVRSLMIVIATAGIFFASTMVLISLGVLAGYQRVYHEAILGFSTHLIVFKDDGLSEFECHKVEDFLKNSSIRNQFSSYHFFETIAPGESGPVPVIFKGIDPDKLATVYSLKVLDLSDTVRNHVFVGADLLSKQPDIALHHVFKYLYRSHGEEQGMSLMGQLPVQGTFQSGYYDFDSRFVIMPMTLLQELFLEAPIVSGYEIRLQDISQINTLKKSLKDQFGFTLNVMSWDELNQSLLQALQIDRTVVFTVSLLVLLIACLNVIGFNFLFFIQRKREFLILSALGMGMKHLRHLLAALSFVLGGLATIAGTVCAFFVLVWMAKPPGVPIDPEVYYVDHIPVYFNYSWFVLFVFGALVLCYVTSYFAGRIILQRNMTANLT